MEFHDEERPSPGPGEVLLEITSVGVCRSDVDYWEEGRIGDAVVVDPIVMGHEFAARVVEVGDRVNPELKERRVAVEPAMACMRCEWCLRGDTNLCPEVRFCGTPPIDGALRQYMAYPAAFVAVLPDDIADDAGAVLEPLAIGVHAIDLARPRLEQSAAIVGAGPVGLSILQAAHAAGVGRVIVLDRLPWRLEAALDLGATDVISIDDGNPVDAMEQLTLERGVDFVFEAAGTDDAPRLACELAAPGGKVFLVGIPMTDRIEFSAGTSRRRGLTVYLVRRSRNTLHRTLAMLQRGTLNAERLVSHVFPFSKAEQAFKIAHEYDDEVIKAIIRVNEADHETDNEKRTMKNVQ
jgi:L-iditol 2-dehydrogenase